MRVKFPVKLKYSPSLSVPRNPNAFHPYENVEYIMQGSARLIWKRKAKDEEMLKRSRGEVLLFIIAGWEPETTMTLYR